MFQFSQKSVQIAVRLANFQVKGSYTVFLSVGQLKIRENANGNRVNVTVRTVVVLEISNHVLYTVFSRSVAVSHFERNGEWLINQFRSMKY